MRCKERLQEFLVENGVSFEIEQHPVAYTAQQLAAAEHVSGKSVAKVVAVLGDGAMAMLVLPASSQVDLDKAQGVLGSSSLRLAREDEFASAFPDCEVGAMPPFGNLYGVPVYVDESLRRAEEITFPIGTHTESMRLQYGDFERLVEPEAGDFALRLQAAGA